MKYILALQKEFEALGGTVVGKTLLDEIVSKDDYHLGNPGTGKSGPDKLCMPHIFHQEALTSYIFEMRPIAAM